MVVVKTFVITLNRAVHRQETVTALVSALKYVATSTTEPLVVQLFEAVDGRDLHMTRNPHPNVDQGDNQKQLFDYQVTDQKTNECVLYIIHRRINKQLMNRGEFGCAWSHYKLYQQLMNDPNCDAYLILEDDVKLNDGVMLGQILQNLPNNFHLVHLAYSQYFPFKRTTQANKHLWNICRQYFNKSSAYILSKQGAQKLLLFSSKCISLPADDILSNCSLDPILEFTVLVPNHDNVFMDCQLESTIFPSQSATTHTTSSSSSNTD